MARGRICLSKLSDLIRMARPVILLAGVLAYALGIAMALAFEGPIDWPAALAGAMVTLSAILMAHYADEYADVDTDSITRRTAFSGGSGVLPSGSLPPSWALGMARVFLVLSIGLTALFYGLSILPPACVWIALLGVLGGWVYALPPVALERRGLGEIDNAVLGAFVMPLMGYATQTGKVGPRAVLALLPVFALVLVNLLGTHWADREADAKVGRRSLVVVLGSRARRVHNALLLLAYGSTLMLTGWVLPPAVAAGIGLSLPVAIWAAAGYARHATALPSSMAMVVGMLGATAGWFLYGVA